MAPAEPPSQPKEQMVPLKLWGMVARLLSTSCPPCQSLSSFEPDKTAPEVGSGPQPCSRARETISSALLASVSLLEGGQRALGPPCQPRNLPTGFLFPPGDACTLLPLQIGLFSPGSRHACLHTPSHTQARACTLTVTCGHMHIDTHTQTLTTCACTCP